MGREELKRRMAMATHFLLGNKDNFKFNITNKAKTCRIFLVNLKTIMITLKIMFA